MDKIICISTIVEVQIILFIVMF